MDANLLIGGNQAFDVVEGASTQAGTAWFGAVSDNNVQSVFFNVDGGTGADMQIMVQLTGGMTSLSESDFFL